MKILSYLTLGFVSERGRCFFIRISATCFRVSQKKTYIELMNDVIANAAVLRIYEYDIYHMND